MTHEAEFCVFNLRSCHLRLTLGRAPLCIHIMGHTEELSSGHPVQSLNNMSHGQNLSSTLVNKPEFFEIPVKV